jgi:hypothetical protein
MYEETKRLVEAVDRDPIITTAGHNPTMLRPCAAQRRIRGGVQSRETPCRCPLSPRTDFGSAYGAVRRDMSGSTAVPIPDLPGLTL